MENSAEKILGELSNKINKIKTEIARQEGARQTVMEAIEKKFGVKTIDGASKLLKKKKKELETKRKQRDELLAIAQEKLQEFAEVEE